MAGNTFGQLFRMTTFGESHGAAIGVVLDGVPPNVEISEADIQSELDRRKPGQSSVTTPRKEEDKAEILSGLFEGKTTGAPLAILIRNTNQESKDYSHLKDVFRPGHADFTYAEKYGIRDYRGGGRSSGRETACRVAAGAVAKKILHSLGIRTVAYTKAVGSIQAQIVDFNVIEKNPVRTCDPIAAEKMVKLIEDTKANGDSIGGIVEAVVQGCPMGLGDPVFDKLNARLAQALFSIATIKALEFGEGFGVAQMHGSEHNDAFVQKDGSIKTLTNHAGGILGGISNGNDIVLRVAVKPPSSISKRQKTVTAEGKEQDLEVKGRHDPCLCPRIVPVIEAMINMTLLDCWLIQKSIQ